VTQLLFEKMLGPYSIKLPTSLITGKRTQSSAACPELARAGNGVRLAMLQEPEKKDVLNLGILKELSGNDTFYARTLFSQGSEITPMFKIVLICNDPPKLPYDDKAAWNRIRVIPFESMFDEDAPDTPEEQLLHKRFPVDRNFEQKIPAMTEAFAWLLLQRWKSRSKQLIEPEKVKLATANYRRKNDAYRQFLDECVVPEPGAMCTLADLYAVFKDWYRDSIPKGNPPSKQELKEYLTRVWADAPKTVKGWIGFRVRQEDSADAAAGDVSRTGALPLPI
jgi:phage/plasmid-associated DNA primase